MTDIHRSLVQIRLEGVLFSVINYLFRPFASVRLSNLELVFPEAQRMLTLIQSFKRRCQIGLLTLSILP